MADTSTVLVIGALGQIGSELTVELRRRLGHARVVAADVRADVPAALADGPFQKLDVTDRAALNQVIVAHDVGTIYHLAALLSATGEKRPLDAWRINTGGLLNVLEAARDHGLDRVFCPSSIATYGPDAPKVDTPVDVPLHPSTMYGITKVAGELLCDYYVARFGVDARALRYPGIVSHATLPGGGTTDYAVAIFYAAIQDGRYTCFVREDTVLPMMYMDDCVRATIELMEAPRERVAKHRGAYNVAAMSFSVGELAREIAARVPGFECRYEPDHRQAFADTWPRSIDDSEARRDWGWRPAFDLARMTEVMLTELANKLQPESRGDSTAAGGAEAAKGVDHVR